MNRQLLKLLREGCRRADSGDEHGSDDAICCLSAALKLAESLRRKPMRVLIVVEGGQVMSVLADEDVRAHLLDYDIDGEPEGLVAVPQAGPNPGETSAGRLDECEVELEPARITEVLKSKPYPV